MYSGAAAVIEIHPYARLEHKVYSGVAGDTEMHETPA